MIKFIKNTGLFLTIIIVIIILLNNIVPTNSYSEKLKIDSLRVNPNLESVTLGRSHAASLDYDYWDLRGVNFALGGRDFAGIDYQITYILNNLPNIKEILVSVSYSSMYFDNESMAHGNMNDARKSLYYAIPSFRLIDSHDIHNFVFGKYLPFMQADHGWSLLKENLPMNTNNWADNFMDSVQIIESGKRQAEIHSRDRFIAESYNPEVIEKNKKYLIDIIEKVRKEKDHTITLIFFTPPYFEEYTKQFPKNDIEEMKAIMNELKMKYDVIYLDFSCDSIISNDNKFYFNADHMNAEGKRLFTLKLLYKLKELGIK